MIKAWSRVLKSGMDRDGNLQHILQWNKNIRDWKWRERWREIKITLNFTVLSTESMLLLLIKQGGGIWGGKFWICFAIGMYPNVSINLLFSSSDFWTVTHYFNSRKPILNCVRKYTNFICLIHSSPAFPAPFIEETVFSPLYILASIVIDRLTIGANNIDFNSCEMISHCTFDLHFMIISDVEWTLTF